MLFGQVQVRDTPRIEQFEETIRLDHDLPCWVKAALPRLTRVALDDKLRVLVWKRMCRQELFQADSKALLRVEAIAAACNMPLRSTRS